MIITPDFIEESSRREIAYGMFSRLLQNRIIFCCHSIDDDLATSVIAQMLFLENRDPKKDISLYINSPGGSVSSGMAIIDVMQKVSCDVSTVAIGLCASMGAVILASGARGKRYALSRAEIMIHQCAGGAYGQASDIEVTAKHIARVKQRLVDMLSSSTGKSAQEVTEDIDRDYYMFAEEARDYGIIDDII